MTDPKDKSAPEPKKEGGLTTPQQAPANENAKVDEGSPQPREGDREGGMIGEG